MYRIKYIGPVRIWSSSSIWIPSYFECREWSSLRLTRALFNNTQGSHSGIVKIYCNVLFDIIFRHHHSNLVPRAYIENSTMMLLLFVPYIQFPCKNKIAMLSKWGFVTRSMTTQNKKRSETTFAFSSPVQSFDLCNVLWLSKWKCFVVLDTRVRAFFLCKIIWLSKIHCIRMSLLRPKLELINFKSQESTIGFHVVRCSASFSPANSVVVLFVQMKFRVRQLKLLE